ncbi:MAG TPA: hypothetical protein VG675_05760 [Bryobacteraceae bacterium]|nr:hypothetical protein [Bryobacteraceae bacterium]
MSAPPNPRRVLVVEDLMILRYLSALLGRRGYTVTKADAATAAEMLRTSQRPDVLITNTPADFVEFAGTIPLLYLAASPDTIVAAQFSRCRVVRKPFQPEKLLEALAELLD